jgi:glutamine synthetase
MQSKRKVLKYLKSNKIDFLRVCYADLQGICRSKDILLSEIKDIYNQKFYFCNGIWTLTKDDGVIENNINSNHMGLPDFAVTPDWGTLRVIPWQDNVAIVICSVDYPDEMISPRNALVRILKKYQDLGLEVHVGPEIEFYLLNKDLSLYCNKKWEMYTGRSEQNLLLDATKKMSEFKTGAYSLVHEYSPSQYEININHTKALNAADNLFLFKYGIKDFFNLNGLTATFYPNPLEDGAHNGLHLHLSIKNKKEDYIFNNKKITDKGKSFIAGILNHANAISAFANPIEDSYKRINNTYGVPYTNDWGLDNRSTYIRIPKEFNRIEIRCADGSSNIYLLLAAVLTAGLDGINNNHYLKSPELKYQYPRKESTLPKSLLESILHLNADSVIVNELGKDIINSYTILKRKEVESKQYAFKQKDIEYF